MGMMQQMFAGFLTSAGAPGPSTDSLFNYVSLLLNGETSSAPYNADTSANRFNLIPGGNPRNDIRSPFVTTVAGSGYFGGADYLTTAANAAFNLITNSFSLEAWVYTTVAGQTNKNIAGQADVVSGAGSCMIWLNPSSFPAFYVTTGGTVGSRTDIADIVALPVNQWNHIVACRSGSVLSLFVNGTRVATMTYGSSIFTDSTHNFHIASDSNGASFLTGYVSSVRLVNGSSAYDATQTSITVPTTPLTAIANTALLTLQNNIPATNSGFIDSSTNNMLVTKVGTPGQGTLTPFSLSGWSGYFNGTSDYLVASANAAFAFGTGDFTVETWVYFNSVSGTYVPFCQSDVIGGTSTNDKWFFALHTSTLNFGTHNSGAYNTSTPWTPSVGQWYHVAAVRLSGVTQLYINGVAGTMSGGSSGSGYTLNQNGVSIGTMTTPFYFSGYLSNTRLVKGTAVYTSAFTPPTAPLTAITNTSLLALQSSRFVDNSTNNFAFTTAGLPQAAAVSPFEPTASYAPAVNGGALYFNGTTDYLVPSTNTGFAFGTGDFTVECWTYQTANAVMAILGTGSGATVNPYCYMNGLIPTLFYNNTAVATGTAITLNTWNHLVFTRVSSQFRIYVNGIVGTNNTFPDSLTAAGAITVGASSASTQFFAGHISNLRVVKGTAIYTSAFTPPTLPLTAITNTQFLLNGTNAGLVDYTGKSNPRSIATAQITQTRSKYGSGAIYFNGNSDYLTSPASVNYSMGTGNFTIECWVYPLAYGGSTTGAALFQANSGSTTGYYLNLGESQTRFRFTSNGTGTWADNVVATTGPALNVWSHVAVVRNGTSLKIYINGVQQGTATIAAGFALAGATTQATVGYSSDGSVIRFLSGYIDDLRVTKGIARYTTAFTPPTSAFPTK